MRVRCATLGAALLLSPITADASVIISEIMYDLDGSDAGHEWIEVFNSGSEDITLIEWTFFESDTNHGIEAESEAILSAGTYAVIADDAATFRSDWPDYDGHLFDSTFSLSNEGEMLVMRDADGIDVDSITYDTASGAAGDGNSLHRAAVDGMAFEADTPTPGAGELNGNTSAESDNEQSEGDYVSPQVDTIIEFETVEVQPPQDIYLRVPEAVAGVVGGATRMVAEVYDATGSSVSDVDVRWSFGDGTKARGRDGAHVYLHEGEYTTVVSARTGNLFAEKQITVSITEPQLQLSIGAEGEWISISNTATTTVDISEWRIRSGYEYFIVPERTRIAPEAEVRFDIDILGFQTVNAVEGIELVSSVRTVRFSSKSASTDNGLATTTEQSTTTPQAAPISPKTETTNRNTVMGMAAPVHEEGVEQSVAGMDKPEEGSYPKATSSATATSSNSGMTHTGSFYTAFSGLPEGKWILALGALMTVSVAAVVFLRRSSAREWDITEIS